MSSIKSEKIAPTGGSVRLVAENMVFDDDPAARRQITGKLGHELEVFFISFAVDDVR